MVSQSASTFITSRSINAHMLAVAMPIPWCALIHICNEIKVTSKHISTQKQTGINFAYAICESFLVQSSGRKNSKFTCTVHIFYQIKHKYINACKKYNFCAVHYRKGHEISEFIQ